MKIVYSHNKTTLLFIKISLWLFFTPHCAYGQNVTLKNEDIFTNMFSAIKNVKTLRTNMTAIERIGNENILTRYSFKLNTSPRKSYSKDLDKGIEVLYLAGQNNNEATVNPNGFPYVSLHLDPYGKTMRIDQHQTIDRLGFSYISNVMYHSLAKYPDAYTKYIKRDADTVWDGSSCYKIEINFSTYTFTKYIVKEKGETVSILAAKYYLSEYEILALNDISWYDDGLDVGQQVLLPSAYAQSAVLFIRKDNYLPVVIRINDAKGFFEEYFYTKLQLNPSIPDAEFKQDFPGYHF